MTITMPVRFATHWLFSVALCALPGLAEESPTHAEKERINASDTAAAHDRAVAAHPGQRFGDSSESATRNALNQEAAATAATDAAWTREWEKTHDERGTLLQPSATELQIRAAWAADAKQKKQDDEIRRQYDALAFRDYSAEAQKIRHAYRRAFIMTDQEKQDEDHDIAARQAALEQAVKRSREDQESGRASARAAQWNLEQQESKRSTEKAFVAVGIVVGKPFPAMTARTLDGKNFSLEAWKGKVVLVEFWDTGCMPYVDEVPKLKAAFEKYHAQGFEIIGINHDDNPNQLARFLAKASQRVAWPQISDRTQGNSEFTSQFAIQWMPTSFLIGRDGTLIAISLHGEQLDAAIARGLGAGAP